MFMRTTLNFRPRLSAALVSGVVIAATACDVGTLAPDGANPAAVGVARGDALATGGNALLRISAINDRPAPVAVRIQGWDVEGTMVVDQTVMWSNDDNVFSTEATEISKKTRVLRFTFVNDSFQPTGNPDDDRNAFIDAFWVNNLMYEAEGFDRTDGIDPNPAFRGCGAPTLTDAAGTTATVADCGNQGDYVEYDLHPGNPMGRGGGLGRR